MQSDVDDVIEYARVKVSAYSKHDFEDFWRALYSEVALALKEARDAADAIDAGGAA